MIRKGTKGRLLRSVFRQQTERMKEGRKERKKRKV
jgi:hypothetical protein